MEKMIKYFVENPEELNIVLEGRASFAINLNAEETLTVIRNVFNDYVVKMKNYWM